MGFLIILSLLYGITGTVYLGIGIYGIIRENALRIFDLVRLMYCFAFGYMPSIIYWNEANGANISFFSNYGTFSSNEMALLYFMFFFSCVAYLLINLVYYSIRHKEIGLRVKETGYINYSDSDRQKVKLLFAAGCITLVVGWISIFLWTSAYGSISAFIQNASEIRSGHGSIYNRFAFMKHFARTVQIALYVLFSAYLYENPKGVKKVAYWLLLLLAILGNYIFFLASDSRITIIYVGLSLMIIGVRHKHNIRIGRIILPILFAIFILLLAVMNADVFTNYIRNGTWNYKGFGLTQSLIKEFGFTVSSEMKAIYAWQTDTLKIKIIDDILNSVASLIPERFIPIEIPSTVWTYNTELFLRMGSGTSPSDMLATSIYELGLIGLIIWPFLYGVLVGKLDQKLWKSDNIVFTDACYGFFSMSMIMQLSHCQLSTFVQGLFPLFVYWVIVWIISHLKKKK